jgi:hypothetical protein
MNNQQQVDKKRHGSKIMRSKSLNVTTTSLIFPFFAKFRSEHKKRKRERVARVQMEKEREERKREKNGIFLFGNSNRN